MLQSISGPPYRPHSRHKRPNAIAENTCRQLNSAFRLRRGWPTMRTRTDAKALIGSSPVETSDRAASRVGRLGHQDGFGSIFVVVGLFLIALGIAATFLLSGAARLPTSIQNVNNAIETKNRMLTIA